jgi:uncharacterized protein (DUF1778 family)
MEVKTAKFEQSRFELRLTAEDRAFFKKASEISGYSTLAGFIKSIVRERAKIIIQENEQILSSQKDKEIFFEAVLSNIEPGEKLNQAAKKYSESQPTK